MQVTFSCFCAVCLCFSKLLAWSFKIMPPAFTFSLPKSSNFPYTCIYTMVIQSWTTFKTGFLKTSKMASVQSMLWRGGAASPRLQLLKSYALTSSTLALCQRICDLFNTCVRWVTITYCRCPSSPPPKHVSGCVSGLCPAEMRNTHCAITGEISWPWVKACSRLPIQPQWHTEKRRAMICTLKTTPVTWL